MSCINRTQGVPFKITKMCGFEGNDHTYSAILCGRREQL